MDQKTRDHFNELLKGTPFTLDLKDNINPLVITSAARIICQDITDDAYRLGNYDRNLESFSRTTLNDIYNLCKREIDMEHFDVNTNNRVSYFNLLENVFRKRQRKRKMLGEVEECAENIRTKKFLLELKEQKLSDQHRQRILLHQGFSHAAVTDLEMTCGYEISSEASLTPQDSDGEGSSDCSSETMGDDSHNRSRTYRLNHVQLGYASICLGDETIAGKHISLILDSIYEYPDIYEFEKRFCLYAARFLDDCPQLVQYYCSKFFFILEFQLIKMCTDLVTISEKHFFSTLERLDSLDDFISIRKACQMSNLISERVKSLLETLYVNSRWNRRIRVFMIRLK